MIILLLKGLLAGLIVGFVTASIQSWVDRFFLVIILVGLLQLPIQEAVVINLIVVSLAALMALTPGPSPQGRGGMTAQVLTSVQGDWALVVLPAALGGILGRVAALNVRPQVLLGVLGVYAVLAGLRMALIKPLPERENKAHPAWMAPIAGLSGLLAGLLSAGGKPFSVPVYNAALGHSLRRAGLGPGICHQVSQPGLFPAGRPGYPDKGSSK